jgi:quercetin dioxygenase-like cupin family protein
MIISKNDSNFSIIENCKNGKGLLHKWSYLSDKIFVKSLCMMSFIILEPTASIGKHQHNNTMECFYILEGEGLYIENGNEISVKEGDLLYLDDGGSHALINSSPHNIKFIAFMCEI